MDLICRSSVRTEFLVPKKYRFRIYRRISAPHSQKVASSHFLKNWINAVFKNFINDSLCVENLVVLSYARYKIRNFKICDLHWNQWGRWNWIQVPFGFGALILSLLWNVISWDHQEGAKKGLNIEENRFLEKTTYFNYN